MKKITNSLILIIASISIFGCQFWRKNNIYIGLTPTATKVGYFKQLDITDHRGARIRADLSNLKAPNSRLQGIVGYNLYCSKKIIIQPEFHFGRWHEYSLGILANLVEKEKFSLNIISKLGFAYGNTDLGYLQSLFGFKEKIELKNELGLSIYTNAGHKIGIKYSGMITTIGVVPQWKLSPYFTITGLIGLNSTSIESYLVVGTKGNNKGQEFEGKANLEWFDERIVKSDGSNSPITKRPENNPLKINLQIMLAFRFAEKQDKEFK